MIDKIVINTDARLILERNGLFESKRIIIRDRPTEICGDNISMNKVIKNDIANVDADIYLMTHTTNPLLSSETINLALNKFLKFSDLNYDSLFTVNKIQSRFYSSNSQPINHNPENLLRTQDLDPYFEENSNLYIFTRNSFNNSNARIGKMPYMLVSPAYESLDIDSIDDWRLGEAIYKMINSNCS